MSKVTDTASLYVCTNSLHLPPKPKSQRERFAPRIFVVGELRDEIEVARAEFVVERHSLVAAAMARGNIVPPALAQIDMRAQFCGETVVLLRVAVGLSRPEIIARYGVEEDARGERRDTPATANLAMPGHIPLLDGKCEMRLVRMIARHEAKEQFGFPVLVLAVVPAKAHAHNADAARILQGRLVGNQTHPFRHGARPVALVACGPGGCISAFCTIHHAQLAGQAAHHAVGQLT